MPFHYGDHTASLKIYKDSFYCFGCGASGDIFDFVMRMERCDFKTALGFWVELIRNQRSHQGSQFTSLKKKCR